jgi:2,3-bisphosphoglycerate-independent phosphoglycerate mutase
MNFELKKIKNYDGVKGPLLFVIMDGVGLYKGEKEGYPGNAFELAKPEHILNLLNNEKIVTKLKAHGTAVGMPSDDDMGNSEVGHNAIGAGRVFAQGARLVDEAIETKRLYEGSAWKEIVANAKKNKKPIHFIGLMSDGNVHSNISQLCALIAECDNEDIEEVYIHGLLDGRDVPPLSALKYFGEVEDYLWALRAQGIKSGKKRDYFIASGGGRMITTMDRYEADWSIVERGYNAHVLGEAPLFPNCLTAIKSLREEYKVDDQYLPAWAVHKADDPAAPVGKIEDGASVIVFNFRGDRAIEISRAFVENEFTSFNRKVHPAVTFAGIMEYDGDLHIPPRFLVSPPAIERTVSEYLANNDISQFAISETQKFGHVTYFWNGNNSAKFNEKTEEWEEIESDKIAFDEAPAMKAREVDTDLEKALKSGKFKFLRVNFANGDMVGHTGSLPAAIEAVKTVDEVIGKLVSLIDELGGTIVITADHGNCEQMIAVDKKTDTPIMGPGGKYKPMTSHTLNPVPFIIHGPDTDKYELNKALKDPGLGNIAATILNILGYEKPGDYLPSIIEVK